MEGGRGPIGRARAVALGAPAWKFSLSFSPMSGAAAVGSLSLRQGAMPIDALMLDELGFIASARLRELGIMQP